MQVRVRGRKMQVRVRVAQDAGARQGGARQKSPDIAARAPTQVHHQII
jgi:hypothetical protein